MWEVKIVPGPDLNRIKRLARRSWQVKVQCRDGFRLVTPERCMELVERDPFACTAHYYPDPAGGHLMIHRTLQPL